MDRYDIEIRGIKFKNLFSGPAPIGRILNYVKLAGDHKLYHKNGFRYTNLADHIGSAWTTEWMIGLEILSLGNLVGDKYILNLTSKGELIYNLIKNSVMLFNEGSEIENIIEVRKQINSCSTHLLSEFENIFRSSIPFLILKDFLNENGFSQEKNKFYNELFEIAKISYDENFTPYNPNSRTTTGENRLPSLVQVCQLLGYVNVKNSTFTFSAERINQTISKEISKPYLEADLVESSNNLKQRILFAAEIEAKYGVDGTIIQTSIVRNSSLQQMFKHNLIIEQSRKCVICQLDLNELLIGSHIKASSISSVHEKIDTNNGLLLCSNHDKLFDSFLISFRSHDGQIMISRRIHASMYAKLQLDAHFKLPSVFLTSKRKIYLEHHNAMFLTRESFITSK